MLSHVVTLSEGVGAFFLRPMGKDVASSAWMASELLYDTPCAQQHCGVRGLVTRFLASGNTDRQRLRWGCYFNRNQVWIAVKCLPTETLRLHNGQD